MQQYDDILYDIFQLLDIQSKLKYSDKMSDYYLRLAKEKEKQGYDYSLINKFENTASSLTHCHKLWDIGYYPRQKTKVVNRINRCKNKFCPNCIKLIQASRLHILMPVIEAAKIDRNLYHLVFTVPSVVGSELADTIDYMNEAFSMLAGYFQGKKKIRGIDFKKYGFYAAIKAIECTYAKKNGIDMYHPHFHVVLALNNDVLSDLVLPKCTKCPKDYNVNKYSKSRKSPDIVRFFSDDTIILQKLWYLLFNFRKKRGDKIKSTSLTKLNALTMPDNNFDNVGFSDRYGLFDKHTYKSLKTHKDEIKAERVTLDKINAVQLGYSVTFDKVQQNEYYEVFKYAFKFSSEESDFMSYEQFKVLQATFYHRRTSQAYSAWYGLKLNDEINDETSAQFIELVRELNTVENPDERTERLHSIIDSVKYGIKVVSKSSIHKYLTSLRDK